MQPDEGCKQPCKTKQLTFGSTGLNLQEALVAEVVENIFVLEPLLRADVRRRFPSQSSRLQVVFATGWQDQDSWLLSVAMYSLKTTSPGRQASWAYATLSTAEPDTMNVLSWVEPSR